MVEAAFDFLNGEDLPSLPVATQAECLRTWSRVEAKRAVAESDLVCAFSACDGAAADGQKSVGAWLARFTRCTLSAARAQVAAGLRVRAHTYVRAALADGAMTASVGRWICDAVKKFYPEDRDAVEQILVEAAVAGADVRDLSTIATAALRKLRPGGVEREEAQRHADRSLTVAKTFAGVGRINGDLTAEATALAETVLDALAVKQGPEDTRSKSQRRHDAFVDALQRLLGSRLLPERGGSKPHLQIDMPLAALRELPGSKQAEDEWIDQQMAALAQRRLHGDQTVRDLLVDHERGELAPAFTRSNRSRTGTGPSQPPLPGPPQPPAFPSRPGLPGQSGLSEEPTLAKAGPVSHGLADRLACDSIITPTVSGIVDRDALRAMTDRWLDAHGLRHCTTCTHADAHVDADTDGNGGGRGCGHAVSAESHARLQRSMLRWAVQALSGPGGLASYLRTRQLDGPVAGASILLDAGADTKTVPTSLERHVRRRDRRCRFPGCDHPAELSQVHHIEPRSRGGPTTLWNLLSLCSFHHLIAVHTWGWAIRLNPDGSSTATGPDGRVLHEHHPSEDPPLHAA